MSATVTEKRIAGSRLLTRQVLWQQAHPEARRAHEMVNRAIRSGRLVRQPCEAGNSPRDDGHHSDYSKPLQVTWLCRRHHAEQHRGRWGGKRKAGAVESLAPATAPTAACLDAFANTEIALPRVQARRRA